MRARVEAGRRQLTGGYGAVLWAMEHYLRGSQEAMSRRIRALRLEIERESGLWSRALNRVAGPALLWSARREARFGQAGRHLEPKTFVDRRNWAI